LEFFRFIAFFAQLPFIFGFTFGVFIANVNTGLHIAVCLPRFVARGDETASEGLNIV
jgi:uncharacterized membrane protein